MITKLDHVDSNSATFMLQIEGHDFEKSYGSRYLYNTDSGLSDKPSGRLVVEDFVGGASDTPVVMLYDFRGHPPKVEQISDKLDVDDIRWRSDGVLLKANDIWYIYRRGTLSRFNEISK